MLVKPKAIISACLLGEFCRYDGKTKQDYALIEAFKDYDVISFCPEAPLFGTPRQRISVVQVNGENQIITDETNENVTKKLEDEINSFIQENPDAHSIVLKSKSPSCGLGTVSVLNEKREIIGLGDGLAAKIFKERFPHAKIMDESKII